MRPREYHLFEGEPITVTVPDPGAGNQFVYNLLPDYVYLLVGVEYLFVTGAAAGGRYHRLFYDTTGLSENWSIEYTQMQGLIKRVMWGVGGGEGGWSAGEMLQGVLPDRWYLIGGSVSSAMVGILAADAITDITLNFVRWADI